MTDKYDDSKCDFSHPGTFGHECGAPAVLAGSKPSATGTKSGIYWVRRCYKCARIKGGENSGVKEWVPYDPKIHRNEWR